MFKRFTNKTFTDLFKFEFDLHKNLWNFFLLGDSYYFIINHNSVTFDFISKEVEDVMGYDAAEYDIEFINQNLHPDD
jgi:hypothetical protein